MPRHRWEAGPKRARPPRWPVQACPPPAGDGRWRARRRLPVVHERWMQAAMAEAEVAAAHGDVPIGAVLVHGERVIARGHNRREVDRDPTAHAELLALRAGADHLGSWRLSGCTLYVTLEPCVMCAGALVLARLDRVVFAADDPKAGAVGALYDVPRDPRLNHNVEVVRGVDAEASSALLRAFFAARRRGRR
ncbi:MAG: tRNA adenosine(34) deaminase TadA [Nitriliruptoraceae bacterium]